MIIWTKIKLPLIILTVGIAAITLITLSKPTPKPNDDLLTEPPKVKVAVQVATREQVVLSATSQGTVEAKREIDLVAQVSGLIVKVDTQFSDGDFFTQDTILIEIDSRDYRAALLNAKSRLAQAQRSLAEEKGRSRQARREWQDLGNKDANELFLRTPQLIEAQSVVAYAQADVEISQLNIERTKIQVPFDGRINETYVNVGQFVTRGTALAKVYDTDIAEVRLPLSDRQLALLDLPMLGTALDSNPAVILSAIIGGKAHQWQGIITRTEASVDVNSRMYYAIVEVVKPFEVSDHTNHSAPLIPGLFVTAKIEGKKLDNVVVLPIEVIVKRTNIYTVNDKNVIEIQPVTVLSKNSERVWIQTKVNENMTILLEKHAVVSPGTVIEPIFSSDFNDNTKIETQVAATINDGE
ncbi:efflux RND transporter periplasmic adaptor subunit [Candidatus Colwellia aromaticivorans]|uniref:efflux RND transporter periplasmic adaptor subunit n=1 Tax=Candidatus Colwellia aromaticivorans TaxID=2267621 RepID=UPI0014448B77|nr:efflux RND transporter periplasmic adaptor subunit [Candidatus Colwellia aromaticivorans]